MHWFLGALLAVATAPVPATQSTRCEVGERPPYVVPGGARLGLLGCARLGVSGRRVDFSAGVSRIDGERELCIDPAYAGRGRRGVFIPGVCKLVPPPARLAVRDAGQPRQGVRGYAYVLWGTAGAASRHVVARFGGRAARAAVFPVRARLARRVGEPPFGVFVVELPHAAACAPVTIRAGEVSVRAPTPRGTRCLGTGAVAGPAGPG